MKVTTALRDNAVLVDFTGSKFSGRIEDKVASRNLQEEKHVGKKAANVIKTLFPTGEMNEAYTIMQNAYLYHKTVTVPWDRGYYLLQNKHFIAYSDKIREFNEALTTFLQKMRPEYDRIVDAQREPLNGLFDRSNYPPVDDFIERFKIHVRFMPVPDSDDFRINVGEDVLENIKKEFEVEFMGEVQKNIETDLLSRFVKPLSNMVDRLKNPENIFRDSLVGNLRELADIVEERNILGIDSVSEIVRKIRTIAYSDPQGLRDNPDARKKTAEDAAELYNKLQQFINV